MKSTQIVGLVIVASVPLINQLHAAIVGTYVDADLSNTLPGSAIATPYSPADDGNWTIRTTFGLDNLGAPGTSASNTLFEENFGTEAVPVITTSVAVPAAPRYSVSILYWTINNNAGAQAAISGQTVQSIDFNSGVDTGITQPGNPGIKLRQAYLGTVTGSNISVDVDDSLVSDRAWYDGISYAPVIANFDVNENDGTSSATQQFHNAISDGGATTIIPFSVIDSGVTMTVTMPAAGDFDRERLLTNIATHPQQDLLRDFVFTTTSPIDVQLSGLAASTNYTIRVYSYDAEFGPGAITNWYLNSAIPANLLGTITNDPTKPNNAYAEYSITTDGSGAIHLLAGLGSGSTIAYFNGLQIVPEPNTALIALLSAPIVARYARRRNRATRTNA